MGAISSNKDSQCLNHCAISADLFLVIINRWGDDYPNTCLANMIWLLTDMSFYSTPKLHEIFIRGKEERKTGFWEEVAAQGLSANYFLFGRNHL